MKKNNILNILLFSFYLLLSGYALITYFANDKLKEQLKEQNDLLSNIRKRDSLLNIGTKKQTETIVKTVDKYIERTFTQGKKVLSVDDLLDYTNKIDNENDRRRDSIKFYKKLIANADSISFEYQIAKSKLKLLMKNYNIEFTTIVKKDSLDRKSYTNKIFSPTIDSALLLLPYYRNKLKYIPEEKSWEITYPKETIKN